mgnify:CR=1 FL=1
MSLYFIVFGVFSLLVLAMSVGVIFAKKPISGSCGGMSAIGMDVVCDVCKGDKSICETEVEKAALAEKGEALPYDAMNK